MTLTFAAATADSLPLHLVEPSGLEAALAALPEGQAGWARAMGFGAALGEVLVVPGVEGPAGALIGLGDAKARARSRFAAGGARSKLPRAVFHLASGPEGAALEEFALGWLLEGYRFTRYKSAKAPEAGLVAPEGIDAGAVEALAGAEALLRDLINTPSADMGPEELTSAARDLAARFGAGFTLIEGAALEAGFPMLHAVGRAAIPRRGPKVAVIDWGSEGPLLALVGKGVCFDTGGLDLKPAASMLLMKKDMGGAAHVLALAALIMGAGLKLRLRVIIGAVENAVGSDSFRPGDILTSRKGLTVEINNTDAEGRLVLGDCLALAAEADPALTVTFATLTGAARVALGGDIACMFSEEDSHAAALARASSEVADPLWRLPFHPAYEPMIEPGIADLDNAPGGGQAGAITAALFLRRFAPLPYVHFDIGAWQAASAPARPKGALGQGYRALFKALPDMLGL